MFRRTLDLFVRPQVTKFVYRTALRLDREEILCGAQGAAIAVNNALGSALRGDSTPLDEISQSGAVDAELHAALMDEVRRGQQYAPDIGEAMNARELQLDELARQRQAISGTARLHDLVLIVGGRRKHFDPFGMYQLKVGSSLVVACGARMCSASCCSGKGAAFSARWPLRSRETARLISCTPSRRPLTVSSS